jgi:hypothetical protein
VGVLDQRFIRHRVHGHGLLDQALLHHLGDGSSPHPISTARRQGQIAGAQHALFGVPMVRGRIARGQLNHSP